MVSKTDACQCKDEQARGQTNYFDQTGEKNSRSGKGHQTSIVTAAKELATLLAVIPGDDQRHQEAQ